MKTPFKSEEFLLYAYCFLQLVKVFKERDNNIYDVLFIMCTLGICAYFLSRILTRLNTRKKKDVSSADQQSQLKTKDNDEEEENNGE
tara:strand:- start:849 stop:1109 length:261 start_codon:yes stop_codon:yes gene_type:complete